MDPYFEKYQCQIALPGFGNTGQQLLQKAKVLIVGMGGLGCPAAQYLAASGIGTLGLVDDDLISLSNLHRQVLYGPLDVGNWKVEVAAEQLKLQNPEINIISYPIRLTSNNIMDLINEYDLILEGTDNLESKCLINDACVLAGKPLVYGAIYQYEGQVSIWNAKLPDGTYSSNYRDVFHDIENTAVPNCKEGGVIPSLAGIVGCMQANEAIKYLTGMQDILAGKLWIMDTSTGISRIIKLKKSNIQIKALQESNPTITLEEYKLHPEKFVLYDVREPDEHEEFNIGGKNLPLNDLQQYLEEFATINAKVILYCMSGKRSKIAARVVKKAYPDLKVYSLKNGLSGL